MYHINYTYRPMAGGNQVAPLQSAGASAHTITEAVRLQRSINATPKTPYRSICHPATIWLGGRQLSNEEIKDLIRQEADELLGED